MEKSTKKRKKSKRLKKRIGIIAVGGLSLVLTVCLSVGATLAWFAGSTWADKSLYMGGPVYVEMAGKGISDSTDGSGDYGATSEAKWMGGSGALDIAAVARSTGTTEDSLAKAGLEDNTAILLPGQRLQVYSQARVFSTAGTTSINDGLRASQSTGANTTNTTNMTGTYTYTNNEGRVTTATTSVLRARFSINVEFDPSVGFNNFTDTSYMANYPVKSQDYSGDVGYTYSAADGTGSVAETADAVWTGTDYLQGKDNEWTTESAKEASDATKKVPDYGTLDGASDTKLTWESALEGTPFTLHTATSYINVVKLVNGNYLVFTANSAKITKAVLEGQDTDLKIYSAYTKAGATTNVELNETTTPKASEVKLQVALANGVTDYSGYPDENVTTAIEGATDAGYTVNNVNKEYSSTRVVHGRRDAVTDTTYIDEVTDATTGDGAANKKANGALSQIFNGTKKSIFRWKFTTALEYNNVVTAINKINDSATYGEAKAADIELAAKYQPMAQPFDGTVSGYEADGSYIYSNTGTDPETGAKGTGNGFYGLWYIDDYETEGDPTSEPVRIESDAFYKARCNAYLNSYVENYVDEYGREVTRTVGSQLAELENSLNNQFEQLINDSSDYIMEGYVNGFTVDEDTEQTTRDQGTEVPTSATWLYVDPKIGKDTNTSEISTSKGGWWYLVESIDANSAYVKDGAIEYKYGTAGANTYTGSKTDADGTGTEASPVDDTYTVNSGTNTIPTVSDVLTTPTNAATGASPFDSPFDADEDAVNTVTYGAPFRRSSTNPFDDTGAVATNDFSGSYYASDNAAILKAKLFEVKPNIDLGEVVGNNNGVAVTKVVSVSFPFVNGSFTLPSKALTNIFANAKISFQISFQAVQAFFPYTTSIDNIDYHWDLLGKEKALNIENAIPVFNEAFDI